MNPTAASAHRLPWEAPGGAATSATLLLSTRAGRALNRKNFNKKVWKLALVRAGVAPIRENGMHALRHWFASVLLDSGESIKAVSQYLGHSDAGFTLRTYTHLMPDSERRMRRAMDEVFRQDDQDGPDTARGPKW